MAGGQRSLMLALRFNKAEQLGIMDQQTVQESLRYWGLCAVESSAATGDVRSCELYSLQRCHWMSAPRCLGHWVAWIAPF